MHLFLLNLFFNLLLLLAQMAVASLKLDKLDLVIIKANPVNRHPQKHKLLPVSDLVKRIRKWRELLPSFPMFDQGALIRKGHVL
mgnify:CR=1 FL=1